jgi:hypothetical protein
VVHRADLTDARLDDATLGWTVFAACPTLAKALGLAAVSHLGPSSIDVRTFKEIEEALPREFLEGVGLTAIG